VLRPQHLYDYGLAAGRYFAVHEHSCRKTSSALKALYEHDVVTSMTGYACICAKAARLHYIGNSKNYCSHTVLRGLTGQNYHVWTTKLRIFGPHRCILSIAVAYCVSAHQNLDKYLRHTRLRTPSKFPKYPIVLVKLFTTHNESIMFNCYILHK